MTVMVIGKWSENPFSLTGSPIPPNGIGFLRQRQWRDTPIAARSQLGAINLQSVISVGRKQHRVGAVCVGDRRIKIAIIIVSSDFDPYNRIAEAILDKTEGLKYSVARVVKVVGFVASAPGFNGQPGVVNGASELFGEVFGDAGESPQRETPRLVNPRREPPAPDPNDISL